MEAAIVMMAGLVFACFLQPLGVGLLVEAPGLAKGIGAAFLLAGLAGQFAALVGARELWRWWRAR